MGEDRCPNCGSDDYGLATEHVRACLTCGYDDEHGPVAVCPGGQHPLDAGQRNVRSRVCCAACYQRIPRDLPGYPRWRSALREAYSVRIYSPRRREAVELRRNIEDAMCAWLAEHPAEPSQPR